MLSLNSFRSFEQNHFDINDKIQQFSFLSHARDATFRLFANIFPIIYLRFSRRRGSLQPRSHSQEHTRRGQQDHITDRQLSNSCKTRVPLLGFTSL